MRCVSLLTVLAASALASPLIQRQSAPPDPGTPCLYLTADINWGGEAQNICKPGGTCVDIPDGLAGHVSSAGPEDGVKCFLYAEPGCRGEMSSPITYPGHSDMQTVATLSTNHFSNFDNRAMSFMCSKGEEQKSPPVVPRQETFQPCLFVSTDKDFKGGSAYLCHGTETCNNFDDNLLGKISSAGPDKTQTCWLFPDKDCRGALSQELRYPGSGDLSTVQSLNEAKAAVPPDFDNRASSYFCLSDSYTQPPAGDHPPVARRDARTVSGTPESVTDLPVNTNILSVSSDAAADPCLYITTQKNWKGYGEKFCFPTATCGDFEPQWSYNILSAGADGGSTCFLYEATGCRGDRSVEITYPGFSNVKAVWHHKSSSFGCFKTGSAAGTIPSVARRDLSPTSIPTDASVGALDKITTLLLTTEVTTDPCMFFTSQDNWQGVKWKLCQPSNACVNLEPWQSIASAGPDGGTTCVLFDGLGCTGAQSPGIQYPGAANVGSIWPGGAVSFRCFNGLTSRDTESSVVHREENPLPATTAASAAPCLYITEFANWQGYSWKYCRPNAECFNLVLGQYDRVKSVGPDGGSVCYLFEKAACMGSHSEAIKYPGLSDVAAVWPKKTASFRCYKDQPRPPPDSEIAIRDESVLSARSDNEAESSLALSDEDP